MVIVRRCSRCQHLRPWWFFRWRDRTGRTGFALRCGKCRRQRGYQRHPDLPQPRYWIREHAIARYRERVRPELTRSRARDEMIRLMVDATLVSEPPAWIQEPRRKRVAAGYLVVRHDLVFCLRYYPTGRGPVYTKVSTVLIPH
jgi:hypothetical protein